MKVLFLLFSFIATPAFSAIYNYDFWISKKVHDYLDEVDKNSSSEGPRSCENFFDKYLKDNVLDITYSLGYFDDSTGVEHNYNGINYGLSPSLDSATFLALRQELLSPCRGGLRLCGFSESGYANTGKIILTKKVDIQGREVLVRITMTFASASEYFERNKGELAPQQKVLTLQSEDNFFNSIKTADIVFYNGHSRNGGGPDFNPPILNKYNKVNYKGYYEIKRIGIKRTFEMIKASANKDVILGLFSCYSKKHFYNDFMKINPGQKLILTSDTIDYFDTAMASMGYLEALLRGNCAQGLAEAAKQGDKIRGGFVGYNLN